VKSTTLVSEPPNAVGISELDANEVYVVVAFLGHVADSPGQLLIPALARGNYPDPVNRSVTLLSSPWTAIMWIVHPVIEDPHI
jgi:hypothetical protein